jgi:hypothetical protein
VRRILKRAQQEGDVDPGFNQVEWAIVGEEVDLYMRERLDEPGGNRREHVARQRHGGVHAEQSHGFAVASRQFKVQAIDGVESCAGAFERRLARFGQCDAPRRAQKQSDAPLSFERR